MRNAMETAQKKQKILDALIAVNTVTQNLRVYPVSSPRVRNLLERIYQAFSEILQAGTPLIFQKTPQGFRGGGIELKESDEDVWQVDAFGKAMQRFGIANIALQSDLTPEELAAFLEILAGKNNLVETPVD